MIQDDVVSNLIEKPQTIPLGISTLITSILKSIPMHRNGLNRAIASMEDAELQHLEQYIKFWQQRGISIDYLADCYLTITGDLLRETVYFKQHKKYRYSSFDEVANSVYYNDKYMSLYMHGLVITLFFWPNHRELSRFFRQTLPPNNKGTYLEIGPGHGYFFMSAMKASEYESFIGIDISETSIRQTSSLIDHYQGKTNKKIELHHIDFLQYPFPNSSYDAIVMGEVLEHIEEPHLFLKQIARIAKKDAYIFVTTCINAPAIDHIYHYKSPEHLEDIFADCDLHIKKQRILPYAGKTLEESLSESLAINVAYVLEKN